MILKRRSDAKTMCDNNLIKVNGKAAKPSKMVCPGDTIEIDTLKGTCRYRILDIPSGNINKDDTGQYYETCPI